MKCGGCQADMRTVTSMRWHCGSCGILMVQLPSAARTTLTDKQTAILDFVAAKTKEQGYPPTRRQIAEALGLSRARADQQLHAIAKKGYIALEPAASRGIRIVGSRVAS